MEGASPTHRFLWSSLIWGDKAGGGLSAQSFRTHCREKSPKKQHLLPKVPLLPAGTTGWKREQTLLCLKQGLEPTSKLGELHEQHSVGPLKKPSTM